MGRRKIEIQPLTDDRNRTVTFVKRKAGLFKKAYELAILCHVDLAVVIVGNNNKIYEFSTVDTQDLFKTYTSNIKANKKPHESKSPENYSNYKKKKHVKDPLTKKSGAIVGVEISSNHDMDVDVDEDSDYDSDSPQPKRHKRSYSELTYSTINKSKNSKVFNSTRPPPPPPPPHISALHTMPSFSNPKTFHTEDDSRPKTPSLAPIKREEASSQRPVLRVQIPTDAKGHKRTNSNTTSNNIVSGSDKSGDTARTITAIESNLQNTSLSGDDNSKLKQNDNSSSNVAPPTPTPKFPQYSSFRSPDTKKPTLPLPIQSKSETNSPASASAPPLPNSSSNPSASIYFGMHSSSPGGGQYGGAMLPTPIFNQMNQQLQQQQQQQQQQSQQFQQFHQPPPPQQQQSPQQQQQQQQQHSGQDQQNQTSNQVAQPESAIRFRPPTGITTQFNNGEQTPLSALPSRYVNDMFPFPSPSNFLGPQDWPSGTTPTTSHMPPYFINMLPLTSTSAGPPTNFPNSGNNKPGSGMKADGNLSPAIYHVQSGTGQGTSGRSDDTGTNPTTAGSTIDHKVGK